MGSSRTRSSEPDLFSTATAKEPSPPSVNSPSTVITDGRATPTPPYALPTNPPSALKHLDDDQLDRLLAAVLTEQHRRGKTLLKSVETSHKQSTKAINAPPWAQGKLNAVRAAFKAGVKPSRIAREFGISQSDVKKALAGDWKQ